MRRAIAAAIAAVGAVVLVPACGCAQSPAPKPSPTSAGFPVSVVRNDGRVLLTHPGSNGDQAVLGGVLGENGSHCITVHDQVVIWPAGTKLLDDGSIVVLGVTLARGATVYVAGGIRPDELPVPDLCHPPNGRYYFGGPATGAGRREPHPGDEGVGTRSRHVAAPAPLASRR